jgi:folate-binding protein YgfZ
LPAKVEATSFVGMSDMGRTQAARLADRAVLSIAGADRVGFLNGLVSNDVALAAPGKAVWAALLTPQGKWFSDFFIFADDDRLLLDCEAAHAAGIAQRLTRFRLRADVRIEATGLSVFAVWNGVPSQAPLAAPDPRLPEAGWRALADDMTETADDAAWDSLRLRLGLPDGSRDMEREKTVLLEAGFDELHGISWTKGCYMGQELTARTRYRGLIKKRLLPVRGEGVLAGPGTPVLDGDRHVGEIRSARGTSALALLRLDAISAPLQAGGAALTVHVPAWAKLSEAA